MVAGLAIITTKNTGCAEVVGDAALLVETRNVADIKAAYKKLVENEALRKELGKKARRRVEEHFCWDRVRSDTRNVYETTEKNGE